jgi:hypothetical protein
MSSHSPDPLAEQTRVMPATPVSGPPVGSPRTPGTPGAPGSPGAPVTVGAPGSGSGAYGGQDGEEITAGHQYPAGPYAATPGAPYTPEAGTPYTQEHGAPYSAEQSTPYTPEQGSPYASEQGGPYGRIPFDPAGAAYGYDTPTEPHQRPSFGNGPSTRSGPRGGAVAAAFLAFLVVALGTPALVLSWRSAVGDHLVPSGLVGGLLAVTGLSVLAAGLFRLLTKPEDGVGPLADRMLRPPVLLVLLGTVLLLAAAIAV